MNKMLKNEIAEKLGKLEEVKSLYIKADSLLGELDIIGEIQSGVSKYDGTLEGPACYSNGALTGDIIKVPLFQPILRDTILRNPIAPYENTSPVTMFSRLNSSVNTGLKDIAGPIELYMKRDMLMNVFASRVHFLLGNICEIANNRYALFSENLVIHQDRYVNRRIIAASGILNNPNYTYLSHLTSYDSLVNANTIESISTNIAIFAFTEMVSDLKSIMASNVASRSGDYEKYMNEITKMCVYFEMDVTSILTVLLAEFNEVYFPAGCPDLLVEICGSSNHDVDLTKPLKDNIILNNCRNNNYY